MSTLFYPRAGYEFGKSGVTNVNDGKDKGWGMGGWHPRKPNVARTARRNLRRAARLAGKPLKKFIREFNLA